MAAVHPSTTYPDAAVAKDNMDLTAYLIKEVAKRHDSKVESCGVLPSRRRQLELITAGQRVQLIKKDPKRAACCSSDRKSSRLVTAPSERCRRLPWCIHCGPDHDRMLQRSFPRTSGLAVEAQGHDAGLWLKLNDNPDSPPIGWRAPPFAPTRGCDAVQH